jgi:hypothetical protein
MCYVALGVEIACKPSIHAASSRAAGWRNLRGSNPPRQFRVGSQTCVSPRFQWQLRASAVFDLSAGKRTETKFWCHHLSSKSRPKSFVASADFIAAKIGTISPDLGEFSIIIEIGAAGSRSLVTVWPN